jgi:hypothetical protein
MSKVFTPGLHPLKVRLLVPIVLCIPNLLNYIQNVY